MDFYLSQSLLTLFFYLPLTIYHINKCQIYLYLHIFRLKTVSLTAHYSIEQAPCRPMDPMHVGYQACGRGMDDGTTKPVRRDVYC